MLSFDLYIHIFLNHDGLINIDGKTFIHIFRYPVYVLDDRGSPMVEDKKQFCVKNYKLRFHTWDV